MDRKGQLANVAFGGAWSEQIAGNEELKDAMRRIERAVGESAGRDLRNDQAVSAVLRLLTDGHPKGAMLVAAWRKALEIKDTGLRVTELKRIAAMLRSGIGRRLSG